LKSNICHLWSLRLHHVETPNPYCLLILCIYISFPSLLTSTAWDIVEELEAADSHKDNVEQRQLPTDINYYPLIQSLDILSQKVERKMDELNKLSLQLAEAGAGEEIERLVYASEEMKGVLRDARARLEQL
jgi:hypothetical protein